VPSCFHPPVPGVQLSCSGASPLRLKSSCWPPFGHQLWRERMALQNAADPNDCESIQDSRGKWHVCWYQIT
jgi:hypothetical protein